MKDDFDVVTGPAPGLQEPQGDFIRGTPNLVGDPHGHQTHGPAVKPKVYNGKGFVPEEEFEKPKD